MTDEPEGPEGPEGAKQEPNIIASAETLAGVFSNWAQVSFTEHEFMLDFARMDPTAPPPGRGILVARIAMSSLMMRQLMNTMEGVWKGYAGKVIGGEVENDGRDEPESDTQG
jgi:hypothetical protein